MTLLDTLLPGEVHGYDRGYAEALERVVARCLHEGGKWSSPRQSDGVPWYRVVQSSDERVRVCGRIFTIGQVEYTFWVDVERTEDGHACAALFFDADTSNMSPRAARSILEVVRLPEDLSWAVTIPRWILSESPR